MSIKSRFKGSFGKQYGTRAQTSLKFACQHLYHIYWSMCRQLPCKKSLLVICKISRLFPNTLSVRGKYSPLNRDNLTQPIKMQLSQKQKPFSQFFAAFLKSSLNFEHFQKKDDSHSWCNSEITASKKHGYINVYKVTFQGILRKAIWYTRPNIVEICMSAPLPYLLINVQAIALQKVSVSDMQNLKAVS